MITNTYGYPDVRKQTQTLSNTQPDFGKCVNNSICKHPRRRGDVRGKTNRVMGKSRYSCIKLRSIKSYVRYHFEIVMKEYRK